MTALPTCNQSVRSEQIPGIGFPIYIAWLGRLTLVRSGVEPPLTWLTAKPHHMCVMSFALYASTQSRAHTIASLFTYNDVQQLRTVDKSVCQFAANSSARAHVDPVPGP